jgi:hypothetical protein
LATFVQRADRRGELGLTKVTQFGVLTFATQVLFLGVGVENNAFSPIYFLTFVLLILPPC